METPAASPRPKLQRIRTVKDVTCPRSMTMAELLGRDKSKAYSIGDVNSVGRDIGLFIERVRRYACTINLSYPGPETIRPSDRMVFSGTNRRYPIETTVGQVLKHIKDFVNGPDAGPGAENFFPKKRESAIENQGHVGNIGAMLLAIIGDVEEDNDK